MSNYKLTIDEQTFDVEIGLIIDNVAEVTVNQVSYQVSIGTAGQSAAKPVIPPAAPESDAPAPKAPASATFKTAGSGAVTAPIPGKVMSILVNVGDKVTAGQVVALIEAMKMENDLMSPITGTVKEIKVTKDAEVATGEVIMVIE